MQFLARSLCCAVFAGGSGFAGVTEQLPSCSLYFGSTGLVLLRVKWQVWRHVREKNTIAKIFQRTASKCPEKTALIFQGTGESWTFRQLDEYSNQVANFFHGQGFRSGDVVALFMESRNQYVGLWLGLAKIGVETALVNSNLRMEALLHCITISNSKAVVFGVEMMEGEGQAGASGGFQALSGGGPWIQCSFPAGNRAGSQRVCTAELLRNWIWFSFC